MPTVKSLDQAGTLFFLSLVFLIGAAVAFLKGTFCIVFACGWFFLILAGFFFFWGFEKSQ